MPLKSLSIILISVFLTFTLLQSVSIVCDWGEDIVLADVEEEKPTKNKSSIEEEKVLSSVSRQFLHLSYEVAGVFRAISYYHSYFYQEPCISIPSPPPDNLDFI